MTMYTKKRTPKDYDGTRVTSHQMAHFLPSVLQQIHDTHCERPDLVLAAWPMIIGAQLAPMTQAISLIDGILLVTVKNSTLHSLLNQYDRPRILRTLQQQFPNVNIRGINFRVS